MLKTLSIEPAKYRKGRIRADNNSRTECDRSELNGDKVDGGEVGDNKVEKRVQ